jgi:hypothetical protein
VRQKGFAPIIILLVVIFLGAIGYVAYTKGYANSLMSKPTPTAVPTGLEDIENKFTVINDDIYYNDKLIISHDKFPPDRGGFSDFRLSPDKLKVCFAVWPPAPAPSIYISGINGENLTEVPNSGEKCVWSHDSTKIAFTDHMTDISQINIYVYDLNTRVTENISDQSYYDSVVRFYSIQKWSIDDKKIIGDFGEFNLVDSSDTTGSTEFDLITGTSTDL